MQTPEQHPDADGAATRSAKMDPTTRRFVELTYATRWLSVYDQNVDKGRSPQDALRAVEVGVAEGKAVMLGGNRRERRARASRRRKAKR